MEELAKYEVMLEGLILRPGMVLEGKQCLSG